MASSALNIPLDCAGTCEIRLPDCREDCTGREPRPRRVTGGKADHHVVERMVRARAEHRAEETRKAAAAGRPVVVRNQDPVTGQFLPGEVVANMGPNVGDFLDASPLTVLKAFFPHLAEESRAAWHVFLKAAFAEPMSVAEFETFAACTGRTKELAYAVREIWLLCGRRAGKSEIVGFLAVYLACFKKYSKGKTDKKVIGMVLAADREQAGVIMGYISEMLHSHPRLEALIARRGKQFRETQRSITLTTGITIRVNTSNYRRVRGYTVAFVLCDEIAFWETEDAANPDHEVLKALRPALGTTRGMLIALTSPYAQRGEAYRNFKTHFGQDESRVLVWKAATQVMNPTFPQEDIDAAYEEDAAAAGAEYGAEFRTDVQALFDPAVVDACGSGYAERAPVSGVQYRAFVDPAGGSGQDSMTLAIAHTEVDDRGQTTEVLDAVHEKRPPFNPDEVTQEFAEVVRSYGLTSVTGDRYAGEWPRERFRAHKVDYLVSPRTKREIYKALLPLVNGRRVELLTNKRLTSQLNSLERKTSRGGNDAIDHPAGAHDDVANAAAGALVSGNDTVQYRVRCVRTDPVGTDVAA